jgi:glycine/D-amino acid oxidase-like deaminating enzyme
VFGAWTAHHLRAGGARVTLVEQYGPANPRASSGDHSRILRCGYGADEIYSAFARRSLDQWRALQDRSRASLWHPCGVLLLAAADDPYFSATRQTLWQGGYAVEELDAAGLRTRYPHLDVADVALALLEPECGVLMARRAVRTLVEDLVQSGTEYRRGRVAVVPSAGAVRSLTLADGAILNGEAFVFACGPWLPTVFRSTLDGFIRPTRQNVVYFGAPPGDERFGPAHTPAWIDRPAGIYGIPDLEDRGLKVGIDEHGPPIDPDAADRTPDAGAIARARAWVERRFPAMQGAPVIEARVCQYENTSNGDLLVDRHPAYDNVWIVGGGSGHGFKHGPAVGEHAATLVLTGAETHPRFSLVTKDTRAARAVF